MYFENVVFDSTDPQTTGRAWEAELGTETLTDEEAGLETRLSVPGGPELDLCFQRVPDEPTERPRLHLDVQAPGSSRRCGSSLPTQPGTSPSGGG